MVVTVAGTKEITEFVVFTAEAFKLLQKAASDAIQQRAGLRPGATFKSTAKKSKGRFGLATEPPRCRHIQIYD